MMMGMNALETIAIRCPYCGRRIDITVDATAPEQVYIEDCQICCHPIQLQITVDDEGRISVATARDSD